MSTIIVYRSKYGSSKQYALWLAEALKCEAKDAKTIGLAEILSYDTIVYVGGLYAGRVKGFKKISKNLDGFKEKQVLLCLVGMTNPDDQEKYLHMFHNNVPEPYRNLVKPFYLRGNQLFSKMSGLHRIMMKAPKSMAEKIPEEKRTEDDKHFLEHFGEDIYYINKESIQTIVDDIRNHSVGYYRK